MYNGLRFYLHAITEHLVSTQECRIIGGGRTNYGGLFYLSLWVAYPVAM